MTGHRILITGGAGFIGSNLTDHLLEQGHRVICLDNFSTGRRENLLSALKNPNFTLQEGDIRDSALCRELCAGVDYVFHEAALGSVPRSLADPGTVNDVNVGGFVNMLKAAADAGVRRFIYASSSSVYGDDPALPKKEGRIGKALSPYAVTKYADEVYAEVFSRLYGLQCVGLRYFNVYGRRQNPAGEYAAVIPRFAAALLEHRRPVIYGDGSQSRDFTYIDNVLSANELAMEIPALPAGRNAPVCNIACGTGLCSAEKGGYCPFPCGYQSCRPSSRLCPAEEFQGRNRSRRRMVPQFCSGLLSASACRGITRESFFRKIPSWKISSPVSPCTASAMRKDRGKQKRFPQANETGGMKRRE